MFFDKRICKIKLDVREKYANKTGLHVVKLMSAVMIFLAIIFGFVLKIMIEEKWQDFSNYFLFLYIGFWLVIFWLFYWRVYSLLLLDYDW